jgi:hypothetical protein
MNRWSWGEKAIASGPSAAQAGAPKAPGESAPSARLCGIRAAKSTLTRDCGL